MMTLEGVATEVVLADGAACGCVTRSATTGRRCAGCTSASPTGRGISTSARAFPPMKPGRSALRRWGGRWAGLLRARRHGE